MNNKEQLIQDGYELLGKYNEELFSYFKLNVTNNIPGVNYYFVDKQGSIVGEKKFISKKDISLAVNIHEKIAAKQRKIFKSASEKIRKNNVK